MFVWTHILQIANVTVQSISNTGACEVFRSCQKNEHPILVTMVYIVQCSAHEHYARIPLCSSSSSLLTRLLACWFAFARWLASVRSTCATQSCDCTSDHWAFTRATITTTLPRCQTFFRSMVDIIQFKTPNCTYWNDQTRIVTTCCNITMNGHVMQLVLSVI